VLTFSGSWLHVLELTRYRPARLQDNVQATQIENIMSAEARRDQSP